MFAVAVIASVAAMDAEAQSDPDFVLGELREWQVACAADTERVMERKAKTLADMSEVYEQLRDDAHTHFDKTIRDEKAEIHRNFQAEFAAIEASKPQGNQFEIFKPMKRIFDKRNRAQAKVRKSLDEADQRNRREYFKRIKQIDSSAAKKRRLIEKDYRPLIKDSRKRRCPIFGSLGIRG